MMEVQHAERKDKRAEKEEEAALTSPDSSVTRTPRRALRGRGATRANSASAPPAAAATTAVSADTNGTPGSGRVLRDRSTRSVPVWRRRDLGVEQDDHGDDDDEEEEEDEEEDDEAEARRRRKTACPRRKRNAEAARDSRAQSGGCKDAAGTRGGAGSRRAQSRNRTPSSRGPRGSARVVCKSEPETETTCGEENKTAEKKTSAEKKSDVKEDEVLLGEEDPPFIDDPKDQTYEPQAQSEDDEGVSSDEDVPFKDDLNDQSYDPKSGRDSQKTRRRAPPRPRDKKEKAAGGEKDKEKEAEVKTEGVEVTDVKQEAGDGADPPRKRGRRRKDDKSPRLPKRRKKPPVQYVRCEMEGCGTVLAHPRYLQHHIKYQHLMKKKYVCPHPSCGRLFRLQKQLLRHAKHHTDQRDYICEFCARAFKSSHNLAVHRMIHTGEKPLQCEICGFTCRQKASLNWHMKKHDADASYQFSCAICGKKFEKKDSVVAHKAKSHPEVLIAEALAANAGALVTTTPPPSTTQVTPVGVGPVMVLDQEQSLHTMQVPVTLALPSTEEVKSETEGGGASVSHPTTSNQTLHFVSAPVSQQQLSVQASPQIVHMTFTTLSHPPQQLPLLSVTHQLPSSTNSAPSVSLLPPQITSVAFTANPAPPPSSSTSSPTPPPPPAPAQIDRKEGVVLWEGGTGNVGGVWEAGGTGESQAVTDSSDGTIQHRLV